MAKTLELLFAPAEFAALPGRDLSQSICVVLDIFRATTTIVTALANGAAAIIPVAEIPDALAIRQRRPDVLLAGERDGLRIRANLTDGIEFDLGNSPREFTAAHIGGKTVALSTTNGSRALRACAGAQIVLVCSFLNLRATADFLASHPSNSLILVCSGTGDQAAYEDILGAGALAELIVSHFPKTDVSDSAITALHIYKQNSQNLLAASAHSRNGRRLLANPDLHDDVPFCLQRDIYPLVAKLEKDSVTKASV